MKRKSKLILLILEAILIVVTLNIPAMAETDIDNEVPSHYIFIGDSRTVEMMNAVGTKNEDSWSCKKGGEYQWFISTGLPDVEKITEVDDNDAVIFLMGVNDTYWDQDSAVKAYAKAINEKATEWISKGADVYFVSVNPVDEDKETDEMRVTKSYNNDWIEAFNNKIQVALNENIYYIDTYTRIKNHLGARDDGIHYTDAQYKEIYGIIKSDIQVYNAHTMGEEHDTTDQVHDTLKCVSSEYNDINKNSMNWSHYPIDYCIRNNLIVGYKNKFNPSIGVTRAMAVQVMYAIAGSPGYKNKSEFKDLENRWYYSAVSWAAENGITSGFADGTFRPYATITRQQLATMLMAFSKFMGYKTDGRADITSYSDYSTISSYAKSCIEWAVSEGLMSGRTSSTINPKGTTTRAELAQIIYNYKTKYLI